MTATAPSFANDIKPLFRESDREAMISAFDLWSFDDVTANSDRILGVTITPSEDSPDGDLSLPWLFEQAVLQWHACHDRLRRNVRELIALRSRRFKSS